MNQKGLAHILFIFVLLAGIVTTVYLAGKTQIFKPKASSDYIKITDQSCVKKDDNDEKYLTCRDIVLYLISPLETNEESSDAGFNLVNTAFAQEVKGGVGYTCEKEGDKTKIYHQECNFRLLGIDFCKLNFPGSKYKLIQESCDIRQKCEDAVTDLFNTVAKCVPDDTPIIRNLQPPVITQPGTGNIRPAVPVPTSSTKIPKNPTPTAAALPTAVPTATVVPRASSNPTTNPVAEPAATTNPRATVRPAPSSTNQDPVVPPTGSSSSATEVVRTTKGYRIAEEIADLNDSKTEWIDNYKVRGVSVEYSIKSKDYGKKTLFVQFRDQDEKIIEFVGTGRNYTSVDINFPDPSKTGAVAKPSATATARATTRPTTRPTTQPVSGDSADCLQGDIKNWKLCSFDQLINLPASLRNLLPNDALVLLSEVDLLRLYSKARLATLPTTRLKDFSNGDLIAIAAASGKDQKTFFSGFDCSRLSSFSNEIRNLFTVECGFGATTAAPAESNTGTTPVFDNPENPYESGGIAE